MTDTSNLVGGTEANPNLTPLTPGQDRMVRQIGSQGRMFVKPGSSPESTRNLPPDAKSVDTAGNPRTGPYDDPGLTDPYRDRLKQQDDAELDRQVQEIEEAAKAEEAAEMATKPKPDGIVQTAGAVAGDVAKGVAVEGLPAIVVGVKKGVTEILDGIEEIADQVPFGSFTWSGLDGDPNTPFKLEMTTGAEAKARGADKVLAPPKGFDTTQSEGKITTVTGNFIKSVGQFMTGWVAGGKVLKGWKTAGTTANILKGMAQGAIADFTAFDGQEKRLSNMLNEMAPELRNPITEFLAADDDDPELFGRLKNALEGAGLGAGVEAVAKGIKLLKQVRKVKETVRTEAAAAGHTIDPTAAPDVAQAASKKLESDVEKALKPAPKPSMAAKAKKAQGAVPQDAKALAADLTSQEQVPNTFDLPMHRINTPDDVQAVILKMVNNNAKNIDKARRDVQSWADTTKKAEAIDALESMAVRKNGDALNAETIVAYKQALIAANEKLLALAQEVKAEPGNTAKQIALRRATAVTHAINMEFMGARAEAGRALQAFKITTEGNPYRALDLETMLRESGGAEEAQILADRILRTAANKGAAFAMTNGWDQFGAGLKLAYTNGLLSGPATPIVNILGNSVALMQDLAVRMAVRTEAGVTQHEAGEAFAVMSGYVGAMKDIFRLNPKQAFGEMSWGKFKDQGVWRGMAPGLDTAMPEDVLRGGREDSGRMGTAMAPADPKLTRPLSAAAFNVDEATGLGRALDALQMFVESPGNVNALGDDFFATLAARGELRAQAFRQAMREGRAQGWDNDAIWVRQAQLLAEPTKPMLDAAERQMKELTFTRSDGQFEQGMQKLRRMMDSVPGVPLGTLLMPFIRTPANLMSYAIRNSPLAPMSARWRNAMAAGGAEKEVALTQFALGTAAYAVFMEATMNGDMTGGGPKNKAQRDAMMRADASGNVMWQPYSVRVGGRWYAYDRLDPAGQNMSLAADLMDIVANSDWNESQQEELSEVTAHVVGAMGAALFDKAILKSTFDTMSAVTGGNTTVLERELGNRAVGLTVPFSGFARTLRRGDDPYMREVSNWVDSYKNSLPVLSDDLAPSRDLWGRPRTYQSGLGQVYDAIQPIRTKAAGGSAIDYEILDNGVSVAMPQRSFTIEGVNVPLKNNPEIYSEYVRLAGEPAFEKLERVVTGDDPDSATYFAATDGPTGGKATYIKAVIEDYRRAAKELVMEQYGDRLMKLRADQLKRVEDARTGTTPVR